LNKVWSIITLIFVGFLFVLVITHAAGFATSAGTVFTGIEGIGTELTGANQKGGT
jgi:hypothetical protein